MEKINRFGQSDTTSNINPSTYIKNSPWRYASTSFAPCQILYKVPVEVINNTGSILYQFNITHTNKQIPINAIAQQMAYFSTVKSEKTNWSFQSETQPLYLFQMSFKMKNQNPTNNNDVYEPFYTFVPIQIDAKEIKISAIQIQIAKPPKEMKYESSAFLQSFITIKYKTCPQHSKIYTTGNTSTSIALFIRLCCGIFEQTTNIPQQSQTSLIFSSSFINPQQFKQKKKKFQKTFHHSLRLTGTKNYSTIRGFKYGQISQIMKSFSKQGQNQSFQSYFVQGRLNDCAIIAFLDQLLAKNSQLFGKDKVSYDTLTKKIQLYLLVDGIRVPIVLPSTLIVSTNYQQSSIDSKFLLYLNPSNRTKETIDMLIHYAFAEKALAAVFGQYINISEIFVHEVAMMLTCLPTEYYGIKSLESYILYMLQWKRSTTKDYFIVCNIYQNSTEQLSIMLGSIILYPFSSKFTRHSYSFHGIYLSDQKQQQYLKNLQSCFIVLADPRGNLFNIQWKEYWIENHKQCSFNEQKSQFYYKNSKGQQKIHLQSNQIILTLKQFATLNGHVTVSFDQKYQQAQSIFDQQQYSDFHRLLFYENYTKSIKLLVKKACEVTVMLHFPNIRHKLKYLKKQITKQIINKSYPQTTFEVELKAIDNQKNEKEKKFYLHFDSWDTISNQKNYAYFNYYFESGSYRIKIGINQDQKQSTICVLSKKNKNYEIQFDEDIQSPPLENERMFFQKKSNQGVLTFDNCNQSWFSQLPLEQNSIQSMSETINLQKKASNISTYQDFAEKQQKQPIYQENYVFQVLIDCQFRWAKGSFLKFSSQKDVKFLKERLESSLLLCFHRAQQLSQSEINQLYHQIYDKSQFILKQQSLTQTPEEQSIQGTFSIKTKLQQVRTQYHLKLILSKEFEKEITMEERDYFSLNYTVRFEKTKANEINEKQERQFEKEEQEEKEALEIFNRTQS